MRIHSAGILCISSTGRGFVMVCLSLASILDFNSLRGAPRPRVTNGRPYKGLAIARLLCADYTATKRKTPPYQTEELLCSLIGGRIADSTHILALRSYSLCSDSRFCCVSRINVELMPSVWGKKTTSTPRLENFSSMALYISLPFQSLPWNKASKCNW